MKQFSPLDATDYLLRTRKYLVLGFNPNCGSDVRKGYMTDEAFGWPAQRMLVLTERATQRDWKEQNAIVGKHFKKKQTKQIIAKGSKFYKAVPVKNKCT